MAQSPTVAGVPLPEHPDLEAMRADRVAKLRAEMGRSRSGLAGA